MSEEEKAYCPDCGRDWWCEDGVLLPHARMQPETGRCPGSGQPATLPPRD